MTLKKSHSTLLKVTTSLIAGLAITSTVSMVTSFIMPNAIPFIFRLGAQLAAGLLIGLILFIIWRKQEKKLGHVLLTLPGFLQGFIRWWLAFQISVYGFAKILKTQFAIVPYRYDMPIGELSGFTLTWYYYGYSYTLAVIIGCLQIIGSIMLLFRQTVLLGVLILLPVMVNIILINAFYDIALGAFINSVLFTLGLVYLMCLDAERITAALLNYKDKLFATNVKSAIGKNLLRLTPVLIAFFSLFSIVLLNKSDKVLYGAYAVEEYVKNGDIQKSDAWLSDSTIFSRVYFSGPDGVAFSPNPFRYKPRESFRGDYTFDEKKSQVEVIYYYGENDRIVDSVTYSITDRTHEQMTLSGIWNSDTLIMKLKRLR